MFRKQNDPDFERGKEKMAKHIAIWGSPHSGKTTLATKLAVELAAKEGKMVMVLYTDDRSPVLPLVFPNQKWSRQYSVGAVLQKVIITTDDVLMQANVYRKYQQLAFLGYVAGENKSTYPDLFPEKVKELYGVMDRIVDYIIVDCVSDLTGNPLSDIGVMLADTVLYLLTPDLKSLNFYYSQSTLYPQEIYHTDRHIRLISNITRDIHEGQREAVDICRDVRAILPYAQGIRQQYAEGSLLCPFRDSGYRKTLESIVGQIRQEG